MIVFFAAVVCLAASQSESVEMLDFGLEGTVSEVEDLLALDVDELSLEDLLLPESDLDLLEIED